MPLFSRFLFRRALFAGLAASLLFPLTGLAQPRPLPTPVIVHAVTDKSELIRFDAAAPARVLARKPVTGLTGGESIVGIDYRVARGVLYALSSAGRLYTLDTATGALKAVGDSAAAIALEGKSFGFDFNPTVDRIRVVSESGQNFRLHPDTGAAIDGDPNREGAQADGVLNFATGDANAGRKPDVVSAAYSYNQADPKITTNYAIDRALGALLMQGSKEGATPVVSPNTGGLRTVGALQTGALADASFDISDIGNVAILAAWTAAEPKTRLYRVDLATGKATLVGTVGDGARLVGIAIEP